ncbi:TfuA-like protein [Sorangium sp. So ce321]|uniref:TfuA-like protein n=1 Tax=Sorangium sp. So ce321 TaxID=3133300 RepID=UPI003F5EFEDC
MTLYMFLGPTLRAHDARALLDAQVLPPAEMGDVCALATLPEPPRGILIIDGYFDSRPAVWHKEILFALSRGIPVWGAASMGALRAVELRRFGMVGVGSIYERFAAGALNDDDEVAVAHAPAELGYRPLSQALVNVRFALDLAVERGVVGPPAAAATLEAARRLFYPDRIWPAILERAARAGLGEGARRALAAFVAGEDVDLKARDARALLRTVAALPELPAPAVDFAFERTTLFERMMEREVPLRRRALLERAERAARGG